MKDSIDFISKLLRNGMDEDYNNIHICDKYLQTHDGVVTLSHPSKLMCDQDRTITIKGLKGVNAFSICEDHSIDINITKNKYNITCDDINFKASFVYHNEYIQRKITKKQMKKATSLPAEFIKFVRSMTNFTIKDSDHQFASSINIINKRMYSTNNICVVRSTKDLSIPIKDCIIPRPLINALIKIKLDPKGIILNEQFIAFTYPNKSFVLCPNTTEAAPDLSAVFNDFKKPIPIHANDKLALGRSIAMSSDDEIICKKGILITDNSKINDINLSDFKVDTGNLEMLLKLFNDIKFTRSHSYMKNDMFEAILAGRV